MEEASWEDGREEIQGCQAREVMGKLLSLSWH
jgi:hypothetical protein